MKPFHVLGYTLAAALFASQANAEELGGTLKNIKETGAITLGFRDASIPFSYLDDSQKPIGFAMDICYEIVDAGKREAEGAAGEMRIAAALFKRRGFEHEHARAVLVRRDRRAQGGIAGPDHEDIGRLAGQFGGIHGYPTTVRSHLSGVTTRQRRRLCP